MEILVTGAAGFIGSALVVKLLERGDSVIGIDNHNGYYDPALKEARLSRYADHRQYTHLRLDITDRDGLENAFAKHRPQCVVNLAAQAGVRYSIENPHAYVQNNIYGFMNVLDACRQYEVMNLVYASSSSVYGGNGKIPFSVQDNVDHPLSLYAASKKSNELMAHTYSHLYGLSTTGLRFFTVYGPWGRPDMAPFKFTKAIFEGKKIQVFNFGNHKRDFTFVDDIISGMIKVIDNPAKKNEAWNKMTPDPSSSLAPWRIYNIGSNKPIDLSDFIASLEEAIGKKVDVEMLPLQPGDMVDTFADVGELISHFDYRPSTSLADGIKCFVNWYRIFYGI